MTAGDRGAERAIARHARRISGTWGKATAAIVETGRRLLAAKAELPHGAYLRLVDEKLPFGARTAERLMAIARHPVLSDATHASHLPPSWMTLFELSRLPPEVVQQYLADRTIHAGMQRRDAVALRPVTPSTEHLMESAGGPHVSRKEELFRVRMELAQIRAERDWFWEESFDADVDIEQAARVLLRMLEALAPSRRVQVARRLLDLTLKAERRAEPDSPAEVAGYLAAPDHEASL